jgi:hypothetical protein
MLEVMMRHLSGFEGSALAAAGLSDPFSLTVAMMGATRAELEHPQKSALATIASANDARVSRLRAVVARIAAGRIFVEDFIAGLGWAR